MQEEVKSSRKNELEKLDEAIMPSQSPAPSNDDTITPLASLRSSSGGKTLSMFQQFAAELDEKYDKSERLVKLSRDLTIESKRIIFQLHRVSTDPGALNKAEEKLHITRERLIHKIALELDKADKYYFVRFFTQGMQEYIEALAFFKFLKEGVLLTYEEFQNEFLTFIVYCDSGYQCSSNKGSRKITTSAFRGQRRGPSGQSGRRSGGGRFNPRYTKTGNSDARELNATSELGSEVDSSKCVIAKAVTGDESEADTKVELASTRLATAKIDGRKPVNSEPAPTDDKLEAEVKVGLVPNLSGKAVEENISSDPKPSQDSGETKVISIYLPQFDFLLGLSDLTGEMMRACVAAASRGDEGFCFRTCEFVQLFHQGCVGLSFVRRDMMQKMQTTRTSVMKMEGMCYGLRIREGVQAKPYSYIYDVMFDENGEDDEDSGMD